MAQVKSTIAVFGATGYLGQRVAEALSDAGVRQHFDQVILFSRHVRKLSHWQGRNVLIRQCSEQELVANLDDVDIVVDATAPSAARFSRQLIAAIARSRVQLFFPAEFDVDHNLHDFRFAEWDWKKSNVALAREVLPHTKICQIFASLFLEQTFGPWLGFCSRRKTFACVGSKDVPVSCTSVGDVARTVAQLALLQPSRIPTQVHIGGTTMSVADVAATMSRESGKDIRVVELPLESFKASVLTGACSSRTDHLRFVMAEGKANHGRSGLWNHNELVNPGETRWKWTTVGMLARQTRGRPYNDADWPD